MIATLRSLPCRPLSQPRAAKALRSRHAHSVRTSPGAFFAGTAHSCGVSNIIRTARGINHVRQPSLASVISWMHTRSTSQAKLLKENASRWRASCSSR